MTPDEFREHFRREVAKTGSAAAWGKLHGLSRQYVSNVLNGHDAPSPKVLEALGMRASTDYEIDKPARPMSQFLTELDCTCEDVRVQARWELDRADEHYRLGALTKLGEWARKWGRSLLSAADEHRDADAERDLLEAEADLERAKNKLADAEQTLTALLDDDRDIPQFVLTTLNGVLDDINAGTQS